MIVSELITLLSDMDPDKEIIAQSVWVKNNMWLAFPLEEENVFETEDIACFRLMPSSDLVQ